LSSSEDRQALMTEVVMAFTDHRPRLAAVATRQSHGQAEGEDVVQDIFAVLCAHPERFDPTRGPLVPLLFTQARRRAVDVSRSERSRRRREERRHELGRHPDSERTAVDRVIADRLRAALARLPHPQREAIVLTYFGNHSYRDVARIADVPEGTVKSRIGKGLRRLRDDLASDGLTAAELAG
jgi:RNA polymerase sigma-70 factor, ECF subfamily